MIFNTHLLISNIVYKYLSKHMNFKLNRFAFAYGNVKPDFSSEDINCEHTLEESLNCVNKYSERLIDGKNSIEQFSISLGVVCHFTCDYFCIYHREGNEKKGIFQHILYEIVLHMMFLWMLFKGELEVENYKVNENRIEEIILKLQIKYSLEARSIKRDIKYAILAAVHISKLIVSSSQLYLKSNEKILFSTSLLKNVQNKNIKCSLKNS